MPSVSLIVCFHNAESTLERTLRSLREQTASDVEFIFVNDGSTDRSTEVIKTFMALNPDFAKRHKLIRTNHGGLAHAYHIGIDNASGQYLMRCDADDYLEPEAVSIMVAEAEATDADIVICPFFSESSDRTHIEQFRNRPASLNDFAIDTLHFAIWNKLFRRDLLTAHDILPFDGVDCWEDLGVVSRLMALSPRIAYVDRPLYHYVQQPASLSRSHKDRILFDHLKMALLLEDWFLHNTPQGKFDTFLRHLKFASKVKLLRRPNREVARWKSTFPEVNSSILSLRHVPLHYRLLFAAAALLPTSLTQAVADTFDKLFHSRNS
ncbi:MAG: glycosyltransferase family 2 protein [Bacteroides sp.]|nr:glycosyltransferase family 2 protein [Bacteroides sp.]